MAMQTEWRRSTTSCFLLALAGGLVPCLPVAAEEAVSIVDRPGAARGNDFYPANRENHCIAERLLKHLRKNGSHDAPVHVRESEVATLKAKCQPLMVDA